ncbi:trehalose-6-phosphate synthase [Naumannella halotolerans]|uniref:Trehalose 6-phosphate synthase n=1 Tax=Naumannella halotolerans TaxID=993414 RepID=A0A4R7JBK3_9ACTN|nr:trehalose-6-phosphate synthase [Naumannella halotolerans]TDT33819.1 trehalose 6-phosphate synthase [Naumannella halotolerans]
MREKKLASKSSGQKADFVVVANRLPVDRVINSDGSVDWRTSPGGLVTALEPVMRAQNGAWVGWHGAPDEKLEPFNNNGLELVPVELSTHEIAEYYEGFSNATLWPLYHDVVAHPKFHREWWVEYKKVNQRFAERTAEVADTNAVVWVQDYQLSLVPQMLRDLRPDLRIGFFLHIPFPPPELYRQLPWRNSILRGMLGADIVGFQLPGGANNFCELVRRQLKLPVQRHEVTMPDDRRVLARAYPISIDAQGFAELAASAPVQERAAQIRRDLGNPSTLVLGIDRLDYTKGLRQRLRAFGELVSEGALSPSDSVFLQVANPSRERVEEYRRLRDDIDMLVGRLNGNVGTIGHPPITYLHTSYPREEMAAMYVAADVMMVTPLRDGMNLVAKEFVASRTDNTGALVLSEFAGAARELKQAYLVNPYDIDGMKEGLMTAIQDSPAAKTKRMKAMRKHVFEHDINHWADEVLRDLGADL